MEKEFVPYGLAVKLKELGFDEPCFGWYDSEYQDIINYDRTTNSCGWLNGSCCSAPTFSQCFKWFREKYNLVIHIFIYENGYSINDFRIFKTYEEAQLACLDKLIEFVEAKSE